MSLHSKFFIFLSFIFIYTHASAQSKKAEKFLDEFIKVSHWEVNNSKLPTMKWVDMDTLTYYQKGSQNFLNDKSWNKFLTNIEALIGMKITRTDDFKSAHIVIYYAETLEYFEELGIDHKHIMFLDKWNGWSNRSYSPSGKLTRTSFNIENHKVSNSNYGKYLIKYKFINALGLLGSSDDQYSIINKRYSGKNYGMTKKDKQFIKLFYSEQLPTNLSPVELREIVENEFDLDAFMKEKL